MKWSQTAERRPRRRESKEKEKQGAQRFVSHLAAAPPFIPPSIGVLLEREKKKQTNEQNQPAQLVSSLSFQRLGYSSSKIDSLHTTKRQDE